MEQSSDPYFIKIPVIADPRGNLSFIQNPEVLPFKFSDISWTYDIPSSLSSFSGPATGDEVIIALSGKFSVETNRSRFECQSPRIGLFIPFGTERTFKNFSSNAVVLALHADFEDALPPFVPYETDPHTFSSVDHAEIFKLDKNENNLGSFSYISNGEKGVLPFEVRRVFYLYDVPADSSRGGHSHFNGEELIVAVSGSFDVSLHDGQCERRWHLDRPYKGLYVPTGLWRTIDNFSGGAICMVLTSVEYSEADYVRDFGTFLELTKNKIK